VQIRPTHKNTRSSAITEGRVTISCTVSDEERGLTVGLSITIVSPAKAAEPIELGCGLEWAQWTTC